MTASRSINDFSDAELAAMVRKSCYVQNTTFGTGDNDSQFLLLVAIPYGKSDEVQTLGEALDAFFKFLQDYDYDERQIQVYDVNEPEPYYAVTKEQLEVDK